jgi:cytochrome o ubiquinol oxidase subunit 3
MSLANLEQQQATSTKTLGFWIYLMTDCVLFATLFATYAVLHTSTAGGPTSKEIFDLPFVLVETLILLTSSFTIGMALIASKTGNKRLTLTWLAATFALGAAFLGMELYEFTLLALEGNSWQRSGFLSAFFTLVGTHGAHILVGLLWLGVLMVRIVRGGLGANDVRRLALFGLFWHFLDIIWICLFTIVYLMGVL